MIAPKTKSSSPLRIGMIGCGAIANAYFDGLAAFARFAKITACADLDLERARQKAAERGVPKACSVQELLDDPEIDLVLNLTIPAAHAEVNLRALKAGKHAYCEKPFALSYKEGLKVVTEAKKRKLRVGCAPDTVLGGGIQTCRQLLDDGAIGAPISASANMMCRGHETWHPSPEFYYKPGGGPLFDMGPYYLTSLVTMLGPVKSVSALAKAAFKERTITSEPLRGKKIKVETPTYLAGLLEFRNGVFATVTMSFDTYAHHQPNLEVHGVDGSIDCPDPNTFGGTVRIWTTSRDWEKVALTHSDKIARGIGLAEMAHSIQKRRPHRMSGELALHVLEIMESFHVAAKAGKKIILKSTCPRPKALPPELPVGELD
jgi:predicted dehydrogenase